MRRRTQKLKRGRNSTACPRANGGRLEHTDFHGQGTFHAEMPLTYFEAKAVEEHPGAKWIASSEAFGLWCIFPT